MKLELPEPLRVLYVSAEPERVRAQLAGAELSEPDALPLADQVSTDEMIPAWACYYYDDQLAEYCLTGLRGQCVEPGAVRRGHFSVLVGGHGFGCGSSRETAPFAQRAAGIRVVFAKSFERIYQQNCHNLGLFTSTDFELLARLRRGESVSVDELIAPLDGLTQSVVSLGGLAAYGRERLAGARSAPALAERRRPQTLAEKILARHWVGARGADVVVDAAVAPGDVGFVRADVRFSHDYVTAMVDSQLRAAFGENARVLEPSSVFLFRDHLTLLPRVMPEPQRRLGLLDRATELADVQRAFARRHGITLFDEVAPESSAGICHNLVVEQLAEPGMVVVGTDSHTCTAGVLGAFAFGVGSTDMAAGLVTRDFRITVPESVRIDVRGRLRAGVSAKDAWLALLSRADVRAGALRGRVIELGGPGLASLSVDERATFTNMAAEAGAFTAIAEIDDDVLAFIARERGRVGERPNDALRPDGGASYAARFTLDLDAVDVTVAEPGDPKNGVPLRALLERGPIAVDLAYGGSCTGGKRADMDMYAAVLGEALRRGRRVNDRVELFIQFGSQAIRSYAAERGYIDLFARAGAQLLEPACGACIRSGPGVSIRREQVTVSAINRNFPGRSGPGQVYLASPFVVAASAIAGRLALPDEFLGAPVPVSVSS